MAVPIQRGIADGKSAGNCGVLAGRRHSGQEWPMLSQKTRYAIRAMQHLADAHGKGPVQMAEIAVAQRVPVKFLATILSELSRAGLVHSQRGKDGGYQLALSPIDITYGDLIRVMRGSLALVPCASRFAHERCKNCLEEHECRLRALMLEVRDQTAAVLDAVRLSDPIEPLPSFVDDDPIASSQGTGGVSP